MALPCRLEKNRACSETVFSPVLPPQCASHYLGRVLFCFPGPVLSSHIAEQSLAPLLDIPNRMIVESNQIGGELMPQLDPMCYQLRIPAVTDDCSLSYVWIKGR